MLNHYFVDYPQSFKKPYRALTRSVTRRLRFVSGRDTVLTAVLCR